IFCFFFFQAEDGIRDGHVTGVQTCALPISPSGAARQAAVDLHRPGTHAVLRFPAHRPRAGDGFHHPLPPLYRARPGLLPAVAARRAPGPGRARVRGGLPPRARGGEPRFAARPERAPVGAGDDPAATGPDPEGRPVQQAGSPPGAPPRTDAPGREPWRRLRVRSGRDPGQGRRRDAAGRVQGGDRAPGRRAAGRRGRGAGGIWRRRRASVARGASRSSRRRAGVGAAGVRALLQALATLGPVGYLPVAPASAASAVVVLIGWFIPPSSLPVALALNAAGAALAVWTSG